MRFGRRRQTPPHLPFIALADIAWQIIIFFLVASTFRHNFAMTVAMPTATGDPSRIAAKQIKIEAGETTLTLNGAPTKLETLEFDLGTLLSEARGEEDRAVAVFAKDDLSFQRNSEILYAIQRAGGIVVIAEEHRENPSRPE
jgi:biopolymer transport protein ExbD